MIQASSTVTTNSSHTNPDGSHTEKVLGTDKLFISATQIKVKEGLERFRKDMGNVLDLAESIKTKGQLQPIVVNRNLELIYGGRRLAACLLGGIKAWIVYRDTADPLEMRELELEENLQRKEFTPAEEILAVEEIHKLKQIKHGESVSGRQGGWRTEDTAEFIGKSQAAVSDALNLAQVLHEFPDLKEAKTASEIRKAAKGIAKVATRIDALQVYEKQVEESPEQLFTVENIDGDKKICELEDKSIDILFTDPPYGIGITETAIGVGGTTGGNSSAGFKYEDGRDESLERYALLAKESFRFIKDNGHAWVFCAPEHFWMIRSFFLACGWQVYIKPIIWVKNASGQNNNPDKWPSSCYEMILYARKIDSRLVEEGKPDWIQCAPVTETERVHQAQKPVALCKELLRRVAMPGMTMVDPYAGSGSSVVAALDLKIFPIAYDKMIEAYSAILERVVKWRKEHNK